MKKKNILLKLTAAMLSAVMTTTIVPAEVYALDWSWLPWVNESEAVDSQESELSEEEILSTMPEFEPEITASPIIQEVEDKRDEYTKHFQTADHSYIAAAYPNAVHYEDNGIWFDIDNTLTLKNDAELGEIYENTASNVHVKFAKTSNAEELVTIEQDNFRLAWNLADTNNGNVAEENIPSSEEASSVAEQEQPGDTVQEQLTSQEEIPENNVSENDFANEKPLNLVDGVLEDNHPIEETQLIMEQEDSEEENSDQITEAEPEQGNFSAFEVENPISRRKTRSSGTALPTSEDEIEAYNQQKMAVSTITSKGTYRDILPNVDLEYIVTSNIIKENVTLKTKDAADTNLSFEIHHAGLQIRLEEDGRVVLFHAENPEEEVYQFAVPYMYDAEQNFSNDVEYELEIGEESSILTISPDREWLKEENRVYPVVIDPNTETSKKSQNIEDTFVRQSYPNSSIVSSYGSFVVGNNIDYNICRSFIKFNNLPVLSKGDIIYDARLYLVQCDFSTGGDKNFNITAHKVKGSWSAGSLTWNNQPQTESAALDYVNIKTIVDGSGTAYYTYRSLNITKLVRDWYNTGINNGVMLKAVDESKKVVGVFVSSNFGSDSTTGDLYPFGSFYYRNTSGIEDYWSYHEQSAGRAGTGYTNDFTGNQVFVHDDASTTGNRLPISVSHVYNLSDSDTASRFGNGWRLNVMQELKESGISDFPYVYTDGDGTKHYFYKDTNDGNKLKDEDGLGLVITDTTAANRTIETKDKYKLVFAGDGYLRKTIDPNGNTTTYTYGPNTNGNYLAYITDPTGAVIRFGYTSGVKNLSTIVDGAGRTIYFAYDSSGNLTQITYPDGTKSTYTYDSKKLKSAVSSDGYTIQYEYTNDMKVPRVSKIYESNGSSIGQALLVSYKNGNTTIYEDAGLDGDTNTHGDNIVTTYNFDNFGRATDVYDADGNASSYEYFKDGAKNNKLSTSGSMQKTIYNYVINPGIDANIADDNWYNKGMDGGIDFSANRVTNEGYMGNTSMQVIKNEAFSTAGFAQNITLNAGTYTLSAYVKATDIAAQSISDHGANILVRLPSGNVISERYIKGSTDSNIDNGWERLSVTITVPNNNTSIYIFGGIFNTTGTAWFDCFQLEQGDVANKVNLVHNSGFERKTSNGQPQNWSANTSYPQDISSTAQKKFGNNSGLLNGKIGISKRYSQSIHVTGKEGDVFSLSGWVKASGLPGRTATISAAVIYDTGDPKWHSFNINPYVSDWQYVQGIISTDDQNDGTNRTYKAIHLYIFYDDQCNPAYFDGIQLVKDDAESYVYDSNGNLISSASAADKSGFTYDGNNNLTKLTNPDGTSFDYGYDSKKNLVSAKSSEGVQYSFSYDSNGNPIASTIQGTGQSTALTSGRIYYIRQKTSGKYLHVQNASDANNANVQQYDFNGSNAQKWKIISVGSGYYKFIPFKGTSKNAMDISDGKNENGANVAIHTDNGSDAQKFKIKPLAKGCYQITAKCSNDTKCLTNQGSYTTSGTNIDIRQINGEHNDQSWYFEPADTGDISAVPTSGKTYMIRARHSGQYLDVNNAATTANADLVQSFYNGGTNQQFRLTDAGGGYYYLEPVHASGMVLSAQGTTSDNLTKVTQQAKDASKDNQKFKFVKVSNGTYRIVSKVNENNGFNVAHISYTQGAAVICHGYIGGTNEQWIFEECSDFISSAMTYTADGRNAATSTDSRGQTTTNTYDSKNRLLTAVTDPNGHTTNYNYDPNNDRLTSVSATVGDQTVTNSYTYTNDKLTSISHNGFNYNFAYDVFGNVTSTSVGNQVLSSNTYLPHNGLLSSSTYGNGATISNVYDKNYNIIEKKYNGESAFKYTYDAYGNTVRHEDLLNQVNYSYNYDMIGRLVGMNSSLGQTLRISYDSKNRTDYVVSKVGDISTKTQYVYGDAAQQQKAGLIYGVKIDDKDTVTYTYDNLARISARTLNLPTPFTTSCSYLAGDKAGSTTTMVGSVNNNGNSLIYTYDNLGNIATVSEKTSTGSVTQKAKYTYDELSQLVREDNKYINKTITYQYDAGGNLQSKKEYEYTTGTLGTVKKTISYAYEDSNWKDKLTRYNGQAVTYDEIGNPLTYRDGMSLTWQNGRQMAALTKGSTSMSFKYDDSGIRTQKTVNGTTTQFYLNGSDILTQITGSERLDFFYDDAGDLLGFKYGGNNYYYIRNLQSDVIGILDSAGTQVVSYVYDSWGKLASISGSAKDTIGVKNPFRYRGYYYDTESGLYYLNSRYYDPEIGRFLNADGILGADIDIAKYNLFRYCGNNPVNYVDPQGYAIGVAALLLGAIAAIVLIGAGVISIPLPSPSGAGWADIPTFSSSPSISFDFSWEKDKAKEDSEEKDITIPPQLKKQAHFTVNPNNFNPVGLIKVPRAGTKNGAFISWMDPLTNTEVFRWDENPNYSNGPHYHIYGTGHYYPGTIVPEPYATIYFPFR